MDSVLEKFEGSISSLGLRKYTDTAERIIVAFSGGADSCLLLNLTCRYFLPLGKTVECAHLNHMIRGEEAYRDERFCEETARKLGLKLHLKRVDIPNLTKNGGSVEEVARRERYAFFNELIGEAKNTVVLTAHNSDDNLETVLFNLVRGSSLKGLCGIPPVRDGVYLRPLLTFSSDEIRGICEEQGILYVTDSTNLENDYTRNYIRNNIVRGLREISESPEISVGRMCALLRQDEEYLDSVANEFIKNECGTFIPNLKASELHDAVLSRVIIRKFTDFSENDYSSPKLEKIHVDLICSRIRETPNSRFSLSLPGNIEFFSEYGKSCFRSSSQNHKSIDYSHTELNFDVPVAKNGYVVLLTKDISRFSAKIEENIYNLSIHKALKFDKIKGNLKIRVREAGDVFRFGGMTHKVKKIFSEKKLSANERETLPIVFDDDGIVWIPGFPVRDELSDGNGGDSYICVFKKKPE